MVMKAFKLYLPELVTSALLTVEWKVFRKYEEKRFNPFTAELSGQLTVKLVHIVLNKLLASQCRSPGNPFQNFPFSVSGFLFTMLSIIM